MHLTIRANVVGQAAPDRRHKDEAPNWQGGGLGDHGNEQIESECAAARAADQGVEAKASCVRLPCAHCAGGAAGFVDRSAIDSLHAGDLDPTDAQRKEFATLAARLALVGLELHRLDDYRLLVTFASDARMFADHAAVICFADGLEMQE